MGDGVGWLRRLALVAVVGLLAGCAGSGRPGAVIAAGDTPSTDAATSPVAGPVASPVPSMPEPVAGTSSGATGVPDSTPASSPESAAPAGGRPDWSTFPVDADPRPIVLTGQTVLVAGFTTGAAKIAYSTGRVLAPPDLSSSPGVAAGRPVISSLEAFARLQADGKTTFGGPRPAPVAVTHPRLATARFDTDRGQVALPAWLFDLAGGLGPVSVMAVAPSGIFATTQEAGNASPSDWRPGPDGSSLVMTSLTGPIGTGPCDSPAPIAEVVETRTTVRVIIRAGTTPSRLPHPSGTPVGCADVGYETPTPVRLAAPLGNRVVLDPSGDAVPYART